MVWVLPPTATGPSTVALRWTAHANRDPAAAVDVAWIDAATGTPMHSTHSIDQRTQGGAWVTLGTVDAQGELTVTLSGSGAGYTIADAVRLQPVDPAPNRFTWALTATEEGPQDVAMRWTAHPNRAANAGYRVSWTDRASGEPRSSEAIVDQRSGGDWATLATVDPAVGSAVSVELNDSNAPNGYLIADGARLAPVEATSGSVTWSLGGIAPGAYEVLVRWTSHPNRSAAALYTIDTGTALVEQAANQQVGGGELLSLGVHTLSAGAAVTVTGGSDGYVVADGVVVVPVSGASSAEVRLYTMHNGHLGTPKVVANPAAVVGWAGRYLPFGEIEVVVAGVEQVLRLPGQHVDAEGHYYNYFRTYDPTIGRYTQSDPVRDLIRQGVVDVSELSGNRSPLHMYSYVDQSPLRWMDSLGLSKKKGVTQGNDPLLQQLQDAARNGNHDRINDIREQAQADFRDGKMKKERWDNVKAWAKLAKDGRLVKPSIFGLCLGTTADCWCAANPVDCADLMCSLGQIK